MLHGHINYLCFSKVFFLLEMSLNRPVSPQDCVLPVICLWKGPYICFCKIQNHSKFEFFNFILNLKPSKKEALLRFKAKFVTQWWYFLRIHDLSLLIFRFASTKSLNKRIIYDRNKCEPPLHCQNCKIC